MASIYDVDTYEPQESIGYLMTRVKVAILAALDRELAADPYLSSLGVTAAQFVVIVRLVGSKSRKSASDLCKELSYDAGAMTRMIDRLEGKGLVCRVRCLKDRRLIYLELTEAGQLAYPRMMELSVRVLNHLLRGFSRSEAQQLKEFLSRMLDNAG